MQVSWYSAVFLRRLSQQQQLRRLTFSCQEACRGCGGKCKQYNRGSRDDGIEWKDTFTVLRRHRAHCWTMSQLCSCAGQFLSDDQRPIHCESCQQSRSFPEVEARTFSSSETPSWATAAPLPPPPLVLSPVLPPPTARSRQRARRTRSPRTFNSWLHRGTDARPASGDTDSSLYPERFL